MPWQSEGISASPDHERDGSTAATFLLGAVHNEIDNAQVGPVAILAKTAADAAATSPGSVSLYYVAAVVQGPLRAYLATAWGTAGHMHGKHIVSYPTMDAAQAALVQIVQERMAPAGAQAGYHRVGTYTSAAGSV